MTNSSPLAQEPVIDHSILQETRSIMKAKFPKMLQFYIEDCLLYVEKIEDGVKRNSIDAVIYPAHTLKSSSNQMGALRLSAIAKDIELETRAISQGQGSLELIQKKLPVLKKTLEETLEVYKML